MPKHRASLCAGFTHNLIKPINLPRFLPRSTACLQTAPAPRSNKRLILGTGCGSRQTARHAGRLPRRTRGHAARRTGSVVGIDTRHASDHSRGGLDRWIGLTRPAAAWRHQGRRPTVGRRGPSRPARINAQRSRRIASACAADAGAGAASANSIATANAGSHGRSADPATACDASAGCTSSAAHLC